MAGRPRVFVSHSHKDNAATLRLVEDLRQAGAEVWVDMADLRDSDFLERINDALARCEWVVLAQSPSSLASRAVRMEINAALNLVLQQRVKAVIPFGVAKVNRRDVPATWATLHYYDGVKDYASALAGLKQAIGLPATSPAVPEQLVPVPQAAPVKTSLPPPTTTPATSEQFKRLSAQPAPTSPDKTTRISRRAVIAGGLGAAGIATLSGLALAAENHGWLKQTAGVNHPPATPTLTPSPTAIPKIPLATDTLYAIALASDGKSWIGVGKNGTILEWTASLGRATLTTDVTSSDLRGVTISSHGTWAVGANGVILQRTAPGQWISAKGSPVTYTVPNDAKKYPPNLGGVVCIGTNALLLVDDASSGGRSYTYSSGTFAVDDNLPFTNDPLRPTVYDAHADGTIYIGGVTSSAGQSGSSGSIYGCLLASRSPTGAWTRLISCAYGGAWDTISLDSNISEAKIIALSMVDAHNGVALAQFTRSGTQLKFALLVGKNGRWTIAVPDVTALTGGASFNDCAMVSPTLAWAVGYNGKIARYDGSTWSLAPQPYGQQNFNKVRATSASDAWVVGDNGVVFHWDGVAWAPYT